MLGVHRDTVVVGLTACADILPPAFLFLEVETGGIWKEKQGDEHTSEAEPWHDVEFHLCGDVVVQDGGCQRTKFTAGGRETVSCGTNRRWVYLGCDEEGDGVGTKLVEE